MLMVFILLHSALLSSCNYNEIFVKLFLNILQNVYLYKKITLKNKYIKKSKSNYLIFKISRSCVVHSSLNRTVNELSLYVLQ